MSVIWPSKHKQREPDRGTNGQFGVDPCSQHPTQLTTSLRLIGHTTCWHTTSTTTRKRRAKLHGFRVRHPTRLKARLRVGLYRTPRRFTRSPMSRLKSFQCLSGSSSRSRTVHVGSSITNDYYWWGLLLYHQNLTMLRQKEPERAPLWCWDIIRASGSRPIHDEVLIHWWKMIVYDSSRPPI